MKISIAICAKNETEYLRNFLPNLFRWIASDKTVEYEVICIIDDNSDMEIRAILESYSITKTNVFIYEHSLNNDFASHKNFMNSRCTGDWILNLDGDECIEEDFFINLSMMIDANPDVEAYWIPRVNTVHGITLKHVAKWNWLISKMEEFTTAECVETTSEYYELLKSYDFIISESSNIIVYYTPIICWPDFQMRLYKNISKIKWKNNVHEVLDGYENFTHMPIESQWAIRHYKNISRQEKQNEFYDTLQRN
jgi:glycosyltransferase involved in cell wall biosynthesis